jgi:hypothetical protein
MLSPMFGFAVRLAIGITCSVLYFSEALGPGLPNYILTFVMIMSAVWKWAYRLVQLITGTSAKISRNTTASDEEHGGISEHMEERIRQASEQLGNISVVHQTSVSTKPAVASTHGAFGKRGIARN